MSVFAQGLIQSNIVESTLCKSQSCVILKKKVANKVLIVKKLKKITVEPEF